MAAPFSQTVIAVVWDFDKTLIPGNMQAPLFARYGVDEGAFWAEVDGLHDFYLQHGAQRVSDDNLYLNHILEYVRAGRFKGLNNAVLRELGRELTFHPGMPDLLDTLRTMIAEDATYAHLDISVEHYIVSTGLRPMIEGSPIRPLVEDVWACEFIEAPHPPGYAEPRQEALFGEREISALAYIIDNTSKTRALFEINKGTNKAPEIHVNSWLPREFRRVPFQNMIYVADGPSDVPAWSLVRSEGGRTLGVYQHGSRAQFEQISQLQRDGRIHAFAEADYRSDSTAWLWLTTEVRHIADRIVAERDAALRSAVRPPARHVNDVPRPAVSEPAPPPMMPQSVVPPATEPSRSRADELRDQIRANLAADGAREPRREPDVDQAEVRWPEWRPE